jgi:hypothetical protein
MSSIKKLTGMGGDIRQIAKLLQAKAPPGHKLAFISEEEAALLKSRGGAGRITPEGIPSYEETYYSDPTSAQGMQPVAQTAPVDIGFGPGNYQPSNASTGGSATSPTNAQIEQNIGIAPAVQTQTLGNPGYVAGSDRTVDFGGDTPLPTVSGKPTAGYNAALTDTSLYPASGQGAGQATQLTPGQPAIAVAEPEIAPQQSTLDKIISGATNLKPQTYSALGIGTAEALLGASQVRKAQQEAAQAKQQLQAMAAPYQQQGQQLQQLAQQGQLTPANQQTLAAARAQLAQGAEARGGVGNQQAANQIATLTQSLLSNQMNMGIQLQSVGDKIAQSAIQTGIQADQYINQLTGNYALNIARVAAGASGLPGQTPTTTITVPSGGQ